MPELPEVETVSKTLENLIKDRKIESIDILYKPIVDIDEEIFKSKLIGQHFRNFKRRGKYLLFEMDDITFVSHLRMEGKYFVVAPEYPMNKHIHVVFTLDNGMQLRYSDVRKFGRMELIELDKYYDDFHGLGLEPFDSRLTVEYLNKRRKKCSLTLKQFLLDQTNIAGIGNIYADEICFALGLRPSVRINRLSKTDLNDMIVYTRQILSKAIAAGGTTIRSYTSSLGVTGLFQLELNVHSRKGEHCPRCNGIIKKVKLATRGTYYCPDCQKGK